MKNILINVYAFPNFLGNYGESCSVFLFQDTIEHQSICMININCAFLVEKSEDVDKGRPDDTVI